MKKSKRTISASLAALLLVSVASCSGSGGGRDTENTTTAATTTPATTNLNDLDHEVDWDEMANIDSVDASNEIGTGPLYTPGQKAGAVNALCYYDLVTEQPELAELLAQDARNEHRRFGKRVFRAARNARRGGRFPRHRPL